ncbi:cytochrome-c peroxidase [Flavobacterium sp. GT3P67]|uniref:cytochrome-c peroxidase n=1 Tax=Flavobacterium sp. GT3P67 TaxID=2541722 RepID=UPI001044CC31|nr:cytochrome c peroxidase [Flavobacterium sp. GT3P67]TDE49852.1 cytochrome-c peroxidase [Flavobacterium sp. GT3P67]
MKLFKSNCTKILILALNLALVLVFFGCEKKYSELTIQQELLSDIEKLNQKVTDFQKIVANTNDEKKIQQAFNSTRLSYKKIEWAVEYFTPDPARFINGPALDELEVAENTFFSPNGFQVMEELIFPHYSIENKTDLIREIKILNGNLKQIKQHLSAITISNSHVLDASKMEINRILALGITGFDSPIALQSIPETKSSLGSLKKLLPKMNFNSPESKNCEKEIATIINQAENYCQSNTDFNTFDRTYFIKNFLNTISKKLVAFQKINAIKNTNRNSVINPNTATIFEKEAFNVNAFIPSEEYRYTEEKAALGQQLFYENSFSDSKTRSCSSCHNPEKAFTDGLKTNQSLNGGHLSRNTPTLTYASLQNAQFWDMRQLDLEKQSLDVIQNKDEMHGNVSNAIQTLNKDKKYQKLFKKAFPTSKKIEEWQIQNSLASYIRSLNAFDSKFDNYMRGNSDDFSDEEKLGFNVFAGKAKCATCHFIPLFNGTVPPSYQKTEQEVIGTPADKNGKKISPDLGRYLQYQMPQLRNAFKTPSLRNVAVTAPYMHNGVYSTLEEVVDFYNKGGGVGMGISVENQTLPTDKLELTEKEVKGLIAFMKTLTDKAYQ